MTLNSFLDMTRAISLYNVVNISSKIMQLNIRFIF